MVNIVYIVLKASEQSKIKAPNEMRAQKKREKIYKQKKRLDKTETRSETASLDNLHCINSKNKVESKLNMEIHLYNLQLCWRSFVGKEHK